MSMRTGMKILVFSLVVTCFLGGLAVVSAGGEVVGLDGVGVAKTIVPKAGDTIQVEWISNGSVQFTVWSGEFSARNILFETNDSAGFLNFEIKNDGKSIYTDSSGWHYVNLSPGSEYKFDLRGNDTHSIVAYYSVTVNPAETGHAIPFLLIMVFVVAVVIITVFGVYYFVSRKKAT